MDESQAVPGLSSVAVVVRTKDRPAFLRRALEDIAAQSLAARAANRVRAVVVNDGGDREVVERLVAEHAGLVSVRVVHNAAPRGRWVAANQGVAAADSDYLVLHDDDDTWHPDFLARTVPFLDEPEHAAYGGVATWTDEVRERAAEDGYVETSREPFLREVHHVAFIEMCRRNLFPPIAYVYRRRVHEVVGPYDESMTVLGDWEFNLRTMRHFDIGMITEPLANWHKRVAAADAADGASRNATAGGEWSYDERVVALTNRLLRSDLDAGALGTGYLVNVLRLLESDAAQRDSNVHLHIEHAIGQLRAAIDGVNQHVTANTERVLGKPGIARRAWRRAVGGRSGNPH